MITRFWSIAALMVVRAMVGREQMSGWYFISLYSIYCEVLYTRKTGPTIDWYKSHCLKSDKFFKKTKIHLWSKLHHKGQQHSLKRNDCLINFWMSNSWIQFKSIKGEEKVSVDFSTSENSSNPRVRMFLWFPTPNDSAQHLTRWNFSLNWLNTMYQN